MQSFELTKPTALAAQRIGALPDEELQLAFQQWRERGELLHYADLILIARRARKHREIGTSSNFVGADKI